MVPIVARGYNIVKLVSERYRKNDQLILMTKEWIRNIERIFNYLRIPNEDKVIYAMYIRRKDACH